MFKILDLFSVWYKFLFSVNLKFPVKFLTNISWCLKNHQISGIQHVLCPESGDIVVLVTEDTALHIVSLNTWSVKFKLCNILKRYFIYNYLVQV